MGQFLPEGWTVLDGGRDEESDASVVRPSLELFEGGGMTDDKQARRKSEHERQREVEDALRENRNWRRRESELRDEVGALRNKVVELQREVIAAKNEVIAAKNETLEWANMVRDQFGPDFVASYPLSSDGS